MADDDPPPAGLSAPKIQGEDPIGGDASDVGVEYLPPEKMGDISTAPAPSESKKDEIHAKAGATLAKIFASALFVMFLMNFGVVVWFSHGQPVKDSLEAVNHVFSTWIPIFSGFVASAATFYYTQNRR
jgi:hypothetical protein